MSHFFITILLLWLWFDQSIAFNQSFNNGRRRLPKMQWQNKGVIQIEDFDGYHDELKSLAFLEGIAMIRTRHQHETHSLCSGALVKPKENVAPKDDIQLYVLTAAHCIWDIAYPKDEKYGEEDRTKPAISKWWLPLDAFEVYFGVVSTVSPLNVVSYKYKVKCDVSDGRVSPLFITADKPQKEWANDYGILLLHNCKDQKGKQVDIKTMYQMRFEMADFGRGKGIGDKLWVAGYMGEWNLEIRRTLRRKKLEEDYMGKNDEDRKAELAYFKGTLSTGKGGDHGDSGGPYWKHGDNDHKIIAVFVAQAGQGGIGVKIKYDFMKYFNMFISTKGGISYKSYNIPSCSDANTGDDVRCWSNCFPEKPDSCHTKPSRAFLDDLHEAPCNDLVKNPKWKYLCNKKTNDNAYEDYNNFMEQYGGYYDDVEIVDYNNNMMILFIGLESIALILIMCLFALFCAFCVAVFYYIMYQRKD